MNEQTKEWVKDILSNDEYSTDEEIVELFVEGGLTNQQAEDAITKRKFYLNNIVLDDESIYKPAL